MIRNEGSRSVDEYRIVCSGERAVLHRLHAYPKPSREKAIEAAQRNDDGQSSMPPLQAYQCAPWRVQKRTVTAWADIGSELGAQLDLTEST